MKFSTVDYIALLAVAMALVLLIVDALPKLATLILSMVV